VTHPASPPRPVVISTRDEAAEAFGAGSFVHRVMSRIDPPPPPTPEQQAELDRLRAESAILAERIREAWAIPAAFAAVGECIALVNTHALALFEVDGTADLSLNDWRGLAFHALALIYHRTPELLPIGPAVHADCHGDDR
jgi:hypothetical protein